MYRRGAQMKAPSERAPRDKYAGGVLESMGNSMLPEKFREFYCQITGSGIWLPAASLPR